MTIYFIDRVTITRERFEIEAISPADAQANIHLAAPRATATEVDLQVTEFGQKPKGRPKGSVVKGSRIPADWVPDVTYAKKQGMRDNEIAREAEKFRNYWAAAAGAKGIKLDWNRTWFTWCMNFCERAGRQPQSAAPRDEPIMSDAQWNKALELYWRNERWHRDFGPEPGRPGCKVPVHLLPEGMRKPVALVAPKAPNRESRPDLFVR